MKKTLPYIVFVCGLLAGVFVCLLFSKKQAADTTRITKKDITELVAQAGQQEKLFTQKIALLEHTSQELDKKMLQLDRSLAQSKAGSQNTANKLSALLSRKLAEGDTARYVMNCDTLREETGKWMKMQVVKDSLYENYIGVQTQHITICDSVASVHEQRYFSLKRSWEKSIGQSEGLVLQNRQLSKQLQKQKLRSTVVTGLAIIVTALSSHYLGKN